MVKQIISSFLHVLRAPALLTRYRLWSYAIAPVIASLVVAISLIPIVIGLGDNIGNWLFSWYTWEVGSEFIAKADDWIGRVLLGVSTLLLFKYLILIVGSPFMSLLSERMEERMYGENETEFELGLFLKDLWRGMVVSVRNLSLELLITFGLFILSLIFAWIPLVPLAYPVVIFFVQAYFAGYGNMDFALERHYDVRNSTLFVRQNRGLAIGNGAAFILLFMIPVVGWMACLIFTATSASHETLQIIHAERDQAEGVDYW